MCGCRWSVVVFHPLSCIHRRKGCCVCRCGDDLLHCGEEMGLLTCLCGYSVLDGISIVLIDLKRNLAAKLLRSSDAVVDSAGAESDNVLDTRQTTEIGGRLRGIQGVENMPHWVQKLIKAWFCLLSD